MTAVIDHFQKIGRLTALLKLIQEYNPSFTACFSSGPYRDAINRSDDNYPIGVDITDANGEAFDTHGKLTELGFEILQEVIAQSFSQSEFEKALTDVKTHEVYRTDDTYLSLRKRALRQCEADDTLKGLIILLRDLNDTGFIPRLQGSKTGRKISDKLFFHAATRC